MVIYAGELHNFGKTQTKRGREEVGEGGREKEERDGERENKLENKVLLSSSFKEIMLHYLNDDSS